MRTKVAVLGKNGMLGTMLVRVLSKNFDVVAIGRDELDAERAIPTDINNAIGDAEWIINAIGTIKPRIKENALEAIRVNSIFPHTLAKTIDKTSRRVIQIATDCVFTGQNGGYTETSLHDATDVYGKTKSLGEINAPGFYNIRCSIIGTDDKQSLIHWFLSQKPKATLKGFVTHHWNGVSTYHFAKLCEGLIASDLHIPNMQHFVPADTVNKYKLLQLLASGFKRENLKIEADMTAGRVDRTLSTNDLETNNLFWLAAGYECPPTIETIINELVKHKGVI